MSVNNCANYEEGICNETKTECTQADKDTCSISRELGYHSGLTHRCGNCGKGQPSDTPMFVDCSFTTRKENCRNTCSEWGNKNA